MNSRWCPFEALFKNRRIRGSRCDIHLFGHYLQIKLSPISDSQHAPRMELRFCECIDMAMTVKNGPEFPKQTALKRFRKEIGKHFVRGTVDNGNALGLETVLHEEITNVDLPRLLPAGCSTILLKSDSALVILIKNVFGKLVPLFGQKHSGPVLLGR